MSNMPERIWATETIHRTAWSHSETSGTGYIRADVANAEIERLKAENCALIVAHGKELRNVTMRSANRTLRREIERLRESYNTAVRLGSDLITARDAEIERLKVERDQAIKVGGIMITGPAGLRNATGHWFHKNDGIAELFVHLKEKENG